LVEKEVLDWMGLVRKLAVNPAKILGIDKGTLGIGCAADIIVVAPEEEWLVEKKRFLSKSKNSPFIGRKLKSIVEYTICQGKIVYQAR
jgi:dihydroorotase